MDDEIGVHLRLRGRANFIRDLTTSGGAVTRFARVVRRGVMLAGGAALGIGAAVTALGIKTAAAWEQNTIAFKTMLGSGKQATALMKQLERFAIETPFEMPQVIDAARYLRAMGFEANQLIPILTNIGDAGAALGLDSEGILRMARALGEIRAKGFPSGEEMRQLANQGVSAWQFLADKIGKTIPETMQLARKREISGATAIQAILEGMQRRYGGMMKAQMNTMMGQWRRMADLARHAARLIVTPFVPVIKWLLDRVEGFLNGMSDFSEQIIPGIIMLMKNGMKGDPLGKNIQGWQKSLYYVGQTYNAIFGPGVVNRNRAFFGSFGRILSPTGKLDKMMRRISDRIHDAWTFLRDGVLPALGIAAKTFVPIILGMLWAADASLKFMGKHAKDFKEPIAAAAIILTSIWATLKVIKVAQMAWNTVTEANPYVAVAAVLIGLGIYLYSLYHRSDRFRQMVDRWWQGFQQNWDEFLSGIHWGGWVTAFKDIAHWSHRIYSWIKKAMDLLDKLPPWLGGSGGKKGKGKGGSFWSLDPGANMRWFGNQFGGVGGFLEKASTMGIPGLAMGGTTVRSGIHMVGENGPELAHINAGTRVTPLTDQYIKLDPSVAKGGVTIPAEFVVRDGGKVLFTLVRNQAMRAAARK